MPRQTSTHAWVWRLTKLHACVPARLYLHKVPTNLPFPSRIICLLARLPRCFTRSTTRIPRPATFHRPRQARMRCEARLGTVGSPRMGTLVVDPAAEKALWQGEAEDGAATRSMGRTGRVGSR